MTMTKEVTEVSLCSSTARSDTGTVSFNCQEDIIDYEIWNLDGEVCISITDDEKCFVNQLFSLSENCQIRFNAGEYTYVGYIR